MYQIWVKKYLSSNVSLAASFLLLLILSIQYPLFSKFPMGGDAPSYINASKRLLSVFQHPSNISLLTYGSYPFANLLFLPFSFLPVSWPMRFILWVAIGQIAVGCAIGWFLYKLAGKNAAAASLAIWAITPIIINRHFEDSTIAQLWSYVFVFLFLERFISSSRWALLFIFLAFFTHPVVGLPLILVTAASLLVMQFNKKSLTEPERKLVNFLTPVIGVLVFLGGYLLIHESNTFAFIQPEPNVTSFQDFIDSKILPIIIIAPFGIPLLFQNLREKYASFVLVNVFIFSFFLFAFNYYLGIGIWPTRLLPLAVLPITVLASLAIPYVVKHAFSTYFSRFIAALCLILIAGLTVWQNNARIYLMYESSSLYMRIHPSEIAAIYWMGKNLPPDSVIIASSVNRHPEWISALTSLSFTSVLDSTTQNEVVLQNFTPRNNHPVIYVIYFLRREGLPQFIKTQPDKYEIVYNEDKAVVVKVVQK